MIDFLYWLQSLSRMDYRLRELCKKLVEERFRSDELVELYGRGTSWCLQEAISAAPEDPWAWDSRLVCDAAFARYLREAVDYAGGRRELDQRAS